MEFAECRHDAIAIFNSQLSGEALDSQSDKHKPICSAKLQQIARGNFKKPVSTGSLSQVLGPVGDQAFAVQAVLVLGTSELGQRCRVELL
jgi:hypothetical protein